MATQFRRLNDGWNADPNAPDPTVQVDGRDVVLTFLANPFQFPRFAEDQRLGLRFTGARRYRLGSTNDEGWDRRPRWARVVLADEGRGRIGSMMARIERLRPGEGDRWRCIRLKALREAPYAFGTTYAEATQWSAARWEARVVEFATFVAVRDGRDVGVARGAAHHRSDVRELLGLWVDPMARRRGIAAQLIDEVATWATAAGATVLVLDVVAGNAAAIALYDRAGFRRFGGEAMGERAPGEVRFVRSLATTVE